MKITVAISELVAKSCVNFVKKIPKDIEVFVYFQKCKTALKLENQISVKIYLQIIQM